MCPIGLEVKLLVGVREAVEIMRGAKIRLDVAPQILLQAFDIAVAALLEGHVDQFARRHLEAGMYHLEASTDALQTLGVGAALAGRIDHLCPDRNILVSAALI